MSEIALILSIVSIIFTGVTAVFSFKAYAEVVGLKNSTHQIYQQMVPLDGDAKTGDELAKEMYKEMGYEDYEASKI